ncbi:MAG TPA: hypothetical protein VFB60_23950 [Ktedonobacteraceae bacterium]|nr:hypothetical protein [Ktedonobacteraceae bacterium]
MKTQLHQWVKTNSTMLFNTGSLATTSVVTSVLGFAYWWLAAQRFPPAAVGFASAAISAMTLIGTLCILGMGTLLIGELPRQRGKELSLISASLILVGGVAGLAGMLFAAIAPLISPNFGPLRSDPLNFALFAVGVSLTAISLVFDQALVGLLRSDLQLWRNALFAVLKLVALFMGATMFFHPLGMAIYATWAFGNIISLGLLIGLVVYRRKWPGHFFQPEWSLMRQLRAAAIEHHMLNLVLQAPALILPVLVTVLLSNTANAWFYVSWMIASISTLIPYALTTVLYATNATQSDTLAHKVRLTLFLAVLLCGFITAVLLLASRQVLGVFGHNYAEQSLWSMRILALGVFPRLIKDHYVAIKRIHRRISHAIVPMLIGGLLELSMAALGAHFGGLLGLGLGYVLALCAEAIYGARTVYDAVRFKTKEVQVQAGRGQAPPLQSVSPSE